MNATSIMRGMARNNAWPNQRLLRGGGAAPWVRAPDPPPRPGARDARRDEGAAAAARRVLPRRRPPRGDGRARRAGVISGAAVEPEAAHLALALDLDRAAIGAAKAV